MRKHLNTLFLLLPAAALAQEAPATVPGKTAELAHCSQIFRDNMDIMVFPMACTGTSPRRQALQSNLGNHIREVTRCETLLAGSYADQTERMQEELDNYVRPKAAEVRAIRDNPQEMQRFCREQEQKSIDLLMKY